MGVFLDMSKAFDKVWHKGLIYKLERAGIRGNLLLWLKSYLTGRKMRVIIDGESSEWKDIEAGVPQGSILGPLLFLIYINDIGEDLEGNIHLYADDSNLLQPINDLDTSIATVNSDLAKLEIWTKKWKMTMNPLKSKCIIFSNKSTPSEIKGVKLFGEQIPVVNQVKHLGLIMDTKLSWKPHIDAIISKANRALAPINVLKFKLPTHCLLQYYKTFIRPILEYASPVWSGCGLNACTRLEQTQYRAMLTISGCIKSTSRDKLNNLLGLPPLEIRRNHDKIALLYKIISGLAPPYLTTLLNEYRLPVRDNRRDPLALRLPRIKKTKSKNDFFYSAADLWNKLPIDIRNKNISPERFKKLLFTQTNYPTRSKLIFFLGNRYNECIFNRFLANLTNLNSDLFRHNIVNDPSCSCGHPYETPIHFLLECGNYAQQRITLLNGLTPIPELANIPIHETKKLYKRIFDLLLDDNLELSLRIAEQIQLYISEAGRA